MEFLSNLDVYIENLLASIGLWGPVCACLLIMIESILPVLPLCVFITLLFLFFGNIFGFFVSWIFTCLGCLLSFYLVRSKLSNWYQNKLETGKEKKNLKKLTKKVNDMSLSSLAMLVAIPFTPAFLVNIACGLSKMDVKKFLIAIIIGKLFMVYFWGFVGTTLIESFKDPSRLVPIALSMVFAFALSKFVNKFLKID